jgi:alpha-galactosidase
MAGNDLRNMDVDVKTILTNKEVIAINQDPLGIQAIKYMNMGEHEVWVKFLTNDEVAICFMNRAGQAWKGTYDWQRSSVYHMDQSIRFTKADYHVRDVWKHKELKPTNVPLELDIPAHGVLMVRLKKI